MKKDFSRILVESGYYTFVDSLLRAPFARQGYIDVILKCEWLSLQTCKKKKNEKEGRDVVVSKDRRTKETDGTRRAHRDKEKSRLGANLGNLEDGR